MIRNGDAKKTAGKRLTKIGDAVKKDFWVVLLDIAAVNLAYLAALPIRFYVNFNLRPVAAERYFPAWEGFAPFYTVLCIIIFSAFHLYGGLWRYAGINDMNRIILATLCTSVTNIAGSSLFFTRMPITYYILGTILQFVFVVSIRFGYRALLVEKKKLKTIGLKRVNCVVIGSGEDGRKVVKNLEETERYRPVAVVGNGSGTMDGIPIVSFDSMDWKGIEAVFIADPLLSSSHREEIRKRKEAMDIELHEYSGFFSNLGGRLSLTDLLSVVHTPLTIEIDGRRNEYEDGETALAALTEKYSVEEIEAKSIKLGHEKKLSTQDVLTQAYVAVLGDESFRGDIK